MNALPLWELRQAIRRLRKDAGSTIASVAALACSIGAAVATWSLLSAVLLKPLPIAEPERLFQVDVPPPFSLVATRFVPGYTYRQLEAFRASGTFDGIAAGGGQAMLVLEQGDVPQSRSVYFATHDYFGTLGVAAARGRMFAEDEDRRGAAPVAVLSDHYWRSAFGADPNVLGRALTIAGTSVTIVGILPRAFRGLHLSEAPDLYLPFHVVADAGRQTFYGRDPFGESVAWIRVVARLPPGDTPFAAAARLNALDCACRAGVTMGEIGPITLTNVNSAAVPAGARANTAQFATLLSITVGLLLLVGCLTVGMLLLVRTEDRRDEIAVRLALGATRTRLAASIAAEAAILCALGAALAVPLAHGLFYGVRAFQLPGNIDVERLDLALVPGAWLAITGVALAATGAIALLASLIGVVAADRSPTQPRALATPRVTRRAPRTALVASQVAITLVLVSGAGLFTRSLIEALRLNPAVEADRIVTAWINLSQHGYTREGAGAFVDELLTRLRENGAIASASFINGIGGGVPGFPLTIDGIEREVPVSWQYDAVEPGFFATIGLPVVSGRSFQRSDTAGSPRVVIVSESLARWVGDGGDPIGRSIGPFAGGGVQAAVYPEIIGVVPDLVTEVGTTEPFAVYQLASQLPPSVAVRLAIRAADDVGAAMREAMAAVRALDARVTLQEVMTLEEQIARQMNTQRFGIHVLGALGGIALLLTVLSTYVTARSLVVRRRRELGIRAALGAGAAQLRGLVLRDTARLVGIGLIAGLAVAAAGARLIRSLLYQVEPLDPAVLGSAAAGIFGLALLVSLRPALEAARVDLTRSLREE